MIEGRIMNSNQQNFQLEFFRACYYDHLKIIREKDKRIRNLTKCLQIANSEVRRLKQKYVQSSIYDFNFKERS